MKWVPAKVTQMGLVSCGLVACFYRKEPFHWLEETSECRVLTGTSLFYIMKGRICGGNLLVIV